MFGDLPLEILRRIGANLSPETALSFAHSCQNTYHACHDWTVWRVIVKGSVRVLTEAEFKQPRSRNKKIRTNVGIIPPIPRFRGRSAVEEYLSQLLMLGYTMVNPLNLQAMYDQCRALVSQQEYPASLVRVKGDSSRWFEFLTDPKSRFDSKEWLAAHTASVRFAIGALSDPGGSYQSEEPFARLEDVQWFNSSAVQESCSDALVMQHALANAAVGLFCLELRAALSGDLTIGEDFEGTSIPPSVSSIPSTAQTWPESLGAAAPSCLTGTTPGFFIRDSWTGYISTRGDWRSVYHGIGGHNLVDLPSSRDFDRMSNTPIKVDHTVKFHLVDTMANGDFVLQSDYFHTRNDMFILNMLVEKRTGRLSVCVSRLGESTPKSLQSNLRNALNTPFGIVHGIEPGSWLWLWKSSWSAGSTLGSQNARSRVFA